MVHVAAAVVAGVAVAVDVAAVVFSQPNLRSKESKLTKRRHKAHLDKQYDEFVWIE